MPTQYIPPQYCSRARAQQYIDGRLNSQSWDGASPTDQDKALMMATTLIDQLNFAGVKADPDQETQFPRGTDGAVPTAIVNACAEIAVVLLDGFDPNKEARNVGVSESRISTVGTKRDTSFVADWVLAGIPSPVAWNFLRPYLNDPQEIILRRVD